MIISLSTWSLSRQSLFGIFRNIQELGFQNIEFNLSCIKKSNDSVYTAKKLILENDLICSSVHGMGFYVERTDEVKTAIYYGKRSIDLAEILMSDLVVIHSFVSDKLTDDVRRDILNKIFSELKEYSTSKGVELAVENLSRGSKGYGKNVSELKEIFDICDIGMTLDFCHAKTVSQSLALIESFNDRIKNIHISGDLHRPIKKITPHLDVFFRTLVQNDYHGLLTIELSPRYRRRILETKLNIEGYFDLPQIIHPR